jgi:Cu/Ag efflux pump CusA
LEWYNSAIKTGGIAMDLVNAMQNLAIGIIGGIFSSVIVSVVTYILDDIRNEFQKARIMLNPLLSIEFAERTKNVGTWDYVEYARNGFEEAKRNFVGYDELQFKTELRDTMKRANEILNKKSYSEEWNKATVDDCYNEIKEIVEDFKEREKQFTKIILERMGKNKILIVMSIITIIVLVCA